MVYILINPRIIGFTDWSGLVKIKTISYFPIDYTPDISGIGFIITEQVPIVTIKIPTFNYL